MSYDGVPAGKYRTRGPYVSPRCRELAPDSKPDTVHAHSRQTHADTGQKPDTVRGLSPSGIPDTSWPFSELPSDAGTLRPQLIDPALPAHPDECSAESFLDPVELARGGVLRLGQHVLGHVGDGPRAADQRGEEPIPGALLVVVALDVQGRPSSP